MRRHCLLLERCAHGEKEKIFGRRKLWVDRNGRVAIEPPWWQTEVPFDGSRKTFADVTERRIAQHVSEVGRRLS